MFGLLTIAGGGAAVGALCRYGIMRAARPLNLRWSLPVTTLTINLTGAFLLGWTLNAHLPLTWQLFIGTGIMGGFTTFSTMINEVVLLGRNHHHYTARLYLVLSLVGGLLMAWIGSRL